MPLKSDVLESIDKFEYDDIEKIRELGKGAFGTVYYVKIKSRKIYAAMKESILLANRSLSQLKDEFIEEASVLASLSHPHIVQLYGYTIDQANNRFGILMEYVNGGNLAAYLRNVVRNMGKEERFRWQWQAMEQIATAVLGLKMKGLLHRDLKCQNILIDHGTGRIKLCDFGLTIAHSFTNVTMTIDATEPTHFKNAGTEFWMAPELFQGKAYGNASEIYSLAVVFFEICTCRRPYENQRTSGLYFRELVIQGTRPQFPDELNEEDADDDMVNHSNLFECHPAMKELIRQCWKPHRVDRWKINQVLDYIEKQLEISNTTSTSITRTASQISQNVVQSTGSPSIKQASNQHDSQYSSLGVQQQFDEFMSSMEIGRQSGYNSGSSRNSSSSSDRSHYSTGNPSNNYNLHLSNYSSQSSSGSDINSNSNVINSGYSTGNSIRSNYSTGSVYGSYNPTSITSPPSTKFSGSISHGLHPDSPTTQIQFAFSAFKESEELWKRFNECLDCSPEAMESKAQALTQYNRAIVNHKRLVGQDYISLSNLMSSKNKNYSILLTIAKFVAVDYDHSSIAELTNCLQLVKEFTAVNHLQVNKNDAGLPLPYHYYHCSPHQFNVIQKNLNVLIYSCMGRIHYGKMNFKGAVECYTNAIQLNPMNGKLYNNRGISYLQLDNYQMAITDCDQAIELKCYNVESAYICRAHSHLQIQEYRKALDDYKSILKDDQGNEAAIIGCGSCLYKLERYQDAIAEFTKLVSPSFTNMEVLHLIASCYLGLKKNQDAMKYLTNIILIYTSNTAHSPTTTASSTITEATKNIVADSYLKRGDVYYEKGLTDQAKRDYLFALGLNSNLAYARYKLGVICLALNENDNAMRHFSDCVRIDPEFTKAHLSRADFYFNLDNHSEALTHYTKAIDSHKQYSLVQTTAHQQYNTKLTEEELIRCHLNRGICNESCVNFQRAFEDFSRVTELQVNHALAYEKKGLLLLRAQQYVPAISEFSSAITCSSEEKYALYHKRGLAYSKSAQYDNAINDFNNALRINPNYGNAYDDRGDVYMEINEPFKAIADYSKSLEGYPNDHSIMLRRAKALISLKSYNLALGDLTFIIDNPKDRTTLKEALVLRILIYKLLGKILETAIDLALYEKLQ